MKERYYEANKVMYGYWFVSREEDNGHLPGFEGRELNFISTLPLEEIKKKLDAFIEEGVPGEMYRLYQSVNPRDQQKTQREVLNKLIDGRYNMAAIESLTTEIAMKPAQADGDKQLFYYNAPLEKLDEFKSDIDIALLDKDTENEIVYFYENVESVLYLNTAYKKKLVKIRDLDLNEIIGAHAFVTSIDFDDDKLLAKWPKTKVEKDALMLLSWITKGE